MASVFNKGTRSSPNWYVKWREGSRQCYQRVGEDRELALRVARKIESELVEGKFDIARKERIEFPSFATAAEDWLRRRKAPDAAGRPMVRSW